VLVGDQPVNDVAGAHTAGWRSVRLDRDGAVLLPDDGPLPDPWWPPSCSCPSCCRGSARADRLSELRTCRSATYDPLSHRHQRDALVGWAVTELGLGALYPLASRLHVCDHVVQQGGAVGRSHRDIVAPGGGVAQALQP
jgi:HAD-hyrolase-like